MVIPLKAEKNTEPIAATIPPSLKAQLDSYCLETGSKQSAAIRHIVSLFLQLHYENSVVDAEKSVENGLKSRKGDKVAV